MVKKVVQVADSAGYLAFIEGELYIICVTQVVQIVWQTQKSPGYMCNIKVSNIKLFLLLELV